MNTPLDTLVARAVHQAKVLERAAHEIGPWTMTLGTPATGCAQVAVAHRTLHHDRIMFVSEFDGTGEQATTISLDLHGRMQSVRPVDFATIGEAFRVTWEIEAIGVPSLA